MLINCKVIHLSREEKHFCLTIEDSLAFNFPNGNKLSIEIQKTEGRSEPHGEIDLIVRTFAIQEKKEENK